MGLQRADSYRWPRLARLSALTCAHLFMIDGKHHLPQRENRAGFDECVCVCGQKCQPAWFKHLLLYAATQTRQWSLSLRYSWQENNSGTKFPVVDVAMCFRPVKSDFFIFFQDVLVGRDRLHMHVCVGEKASFPLPGVGGCSRELLVLLERWNWRGCVEMSVEEHSCRGLLCKSSSSSTSYVSLSPSLCLSRSLSHIQLLPLDHFVLNSIQKTPLHSVHSLVLLPVSSRWGEARISCGLKWEYGIELHCYSSSLSSYCCFCTFLCVPPDSVTLASVLGSFSIKCHHFYCVCFSYQTIIITQSTNVKFFGLSLLLFIWSPGRRCSY